MKIQKSLIPFHSNLILEPVGPRTQSDGGIIIPSVAQVQVNQGKVLDMGPLCSTDKIKVGDIVFFPMHTENRINLSDTHKYIVVDESHVLGVIRTEEVEENETIYTVIEWCKILDKEILDFDGFKDLKQTDKISQKDFEKRLVFYTQRQAIQKHAK